jgi:hypothetical protein
MPEFFNKALLLGKTKRKLGIFYFKLPIEDKDLLTIVDEDTIPTYSIYFPQEVKATITESDRVPGKQNTFYIDEKHIGTEVNIVDIELISGTYDPMSTAMFRPMSPFDAMNMQMHLDLTSAVADPIAYKFYPPNEIEIIGGRVMLGTFYANLLVTHNKLLTSIRPSQVDSFTKLAILDTKIFLYQNLKHFDQMETTFGTINLKIDDWANAETEREELISQWNDKYLANRSRNIYVF